MLSILVLSHKGEGYDIASRLSQEGHLVKFWSNTPAKYPDAQAGFRQPQTVNRYENHLETADLVLQYGAGGHPRAAAAVGARGGLVLGGGVASQLASNLALKAAWEKLVDVSSLPTGLFVGGTFDGNQFKNTLEGFNYRRMLDNERGPDLGTMGCLVWKAGEEADKGLKHFAELLAPIGYKGFFGFEILPEAKLKFYVGEDCFWFLASTELWTNLTVADYLYQLATGSLNDSQIDRFGLAVRCVSWQPIKLTVHPKAGKHVWIPANEKSLAVITSCGEDVREAKRRAYRTVANNIPIDAIYRTDIGHSPDWQEGVDHAAQAR